MITIPGSEPRVVATARRLALPPIQVAVKAPTAFQASGGSQGRSSRKPSIAPAAMPSAPAPIATIAVRPRRSVARRSEDSSRSTRQPGSR